MKRHIPIFVFAMFFVLALAPVSSFGDFQQQAAQAKKAAPAQPQKAEQSSELTIDQIIDMVKRGRSENLIIAMIKQNNKAFHLTPDQMNRLDDAKVSENIIMTMMNPQFQPTQSSAAPGNPPPASPVSVTPAPAQASQTLSKPLVPVSSDVPTSSSAAPQPYVVQVASSGKSLLATQVPVAINTKVKGNNMATIAASDEAHNIASTVILSAASHAAMVLPGVAGMPLIDAAGRVLGKIDGLLPSALAPKITIIYALAGRKSPTVLSTNTPKFEVSFGDVIGVNPDNFEPILIKLSSTDNNWRLAYAEKTNTSYLHSNDRTEHSFIENRIPIRTNKLERGHVGLEPQQPLDFGEYAIVMRPVTSTYKISFKDMMARGGDGLFIASLWDFSVAAKQ